MKWMNYFCLVITLFSVNLATAQSNEELIAGGNDAYTNNQYQEAITQYQAVIGRGFESAELYFNLANAHYKIRSLPKAILYYEKALKLKPADEDIRFNLEIANQQIVDKFEKVPELFYKRWWRNVFNLYPANIWAVLSIIFFNLILLFSLLYLLSGKRTLRKTGFWFAALCLLFFIHTLTFAWQKYNTLNHEKEAIIFTPTITIKSSPSDNSVDLFVLHEGTKVAILDKVNDWYEIKIQDGSKGWIQAQTLQII